MESIARNQFPITVWREGRKLLWNPIHKKALKNRPEERVRLRIIEYLLQARWSRHRISTEEAIADYASEQLRTDIICYSQNFEPLILVECKAENISLSTNTAEQISRYNRNIQAPYLLISNGRSDLWYHIDHSSEAVDALNTLPVLLQKTNDTPTNYNYWNKRGFAGKKAVPKLRKWLIPILQQFKNQDSSTASAIIKYLDFQNSPTDLNVSHYYFILGFENHKVALSFLNTPFGGTRLIAILNSGGTNRALAEINLDLIFEGERPNSSIYSAEGIHNFDFRETSKEMLDREDPEITLREIATNLSSVFAKHF